MKRYFRVPSFGTSIALVALFAALGGTAFAAGTIVAKAKNSERLGGKPASAYVLKSQEKNYLLKSQQPLRSTGLVSVGLGQTKTLFSLAGGKLLIQGLCATAGGMTDAEILATPKEHGVYWLSNVDQMQEGATETLVSTGDVSGSYVSYAASDLTTPQGDYYLQETFGANPGAAYKGSCIFDARVEN